VILTEGNTSEVLSDDLIAVKSFGSYMSAATKDDFVTVSVSEIVAIIEDPASTQEQLTRVLDARAQKGVRRRGSIETLVHASVRALTPARFVAHSHPTPGPSQAHVFYRTGTSVHHGRVSPTTIRSPERGEVLGQIQSARPELPWRQVIGIRNRVVHATSTSTLTCCRTRSRAPFLGLSARSNRCGETQTRRAQR